MSVEGRGNFRMYVTLKAKKGHGQYGTDETDLGPYRFTSLKSALKWLREQYPDNLLHVWVWHHDDIVFDERYDNAPA